MVAANDQLEVVAEQVQLNLLHEPLQATHAARRAAGWSDPAAKGARPWASACPILLGRSIAVTAIWEDLGSLAERALMIYVQQALSWRSHFRR
jgi:hypothetical protein